jgi:hypothetical protein
VLLRRNIVIDAETAQLAAAAVQAALQYPPEWTSGGDFIKTLATQSCAVCGGA